MRIISLLVSVRPDRMDDCRAQMAAMPGVQIHALTPPSRLAVTVEDVDGSDPLDVMMDIQRLPGVLALNLAYEHTDAGDGRDAMPSSGNPIQETAR